MADSRVQEGSFLWFAQKLGIPKSTAAKLGKEECEKLIQEKQLKELEDRFKTTPEIITEVQKFDTKDTMNTFYSSIIPNIENNTSEYVNLSCDAFVDYLSNEKPTNQQYKKAVLALKLMKMFIEIKKTKNH